MSLILIISKKHYNRKIFQRALPDQNLSKISSELSINILFSIA